MQKATTHLEQILQRELQDSRIRSAPNPAELYARKTSVDRIAGWRGLVLQVNSNATVNVTLEVGQVSEQVEVQANAALVETRAFIPPPSSI